ncbi:glycosyltransferase family 4 protein [Flavobacterium sp. ANB]|uniref:glycosyltransferase n=1 Tax=unclassified Flavobacterium TaxID=196869 RepID=UPI00188A98C2|nr:MULTISPECIES: glycosyltransferase [unclassified Flavobacterium]MBF4516555.1 glycosyltransferase family 4 protein [Flavobacterium sp. ANB]
MKILYFYPENPLSYSQGNNSRALALLNYFKIRNFYVDLVAEKSEAFEEGSLVKLKNEKLINDGFLLNRYNKTDNRLHYYFDYSFPRQINKQLGNIIRDFDRTQYGYKEQFLKIVNDNNYDIIIISYAYWVPLLDKVIKAKNSKWIIDTHDFLTSQFQSNKKFVLDQYFKTEINLMQKFDNIWVISNEEKYLFSQFIKSPVSLVTHGLPNNVETSAKTEKTIDITYVASENFHNIKSAEWFFTEVYPTLPKNIRITVVGKINNHIPKFENVQNLSFIEDLDDIYNKTKITICPMLSGTGVKIKVIESLSHGIPVVCTERGVDGLLNKINNGCLVTNNPLLFSQYICKLLDDKDFYNKNHLEAKNFFEENFDVKKTYEVLDNIFLTNIQSNTTA